MRVQSQTLIDASQTDVDVPIPTGNEAGIPFRMMRERAKAACQAALALRAAGYRDGSAPVGNQLSLDPVQRMQQEDRMEMLKEVAQAHASNKLSNAVMDTAITLSKTTAGAIQVDGILSEFDMMVVQDAQRLRNYVTNRLVMESDHKDPRVRIQALTLLGKISDVGLFTERSEITLNNKSTAELENSLKSKLQKLMNPGLTTNAEPIDDAVIIAEPIKLNKTIDAMQELQGL